MQLRLQPDPMVDAAADDLQCRHGESRDVRAGLVGPHLDPVAGDLRHRIEGKFRPTRSCPRVPVGQFVGFLTVLGGAVATSRSIRLRPACMNSCSRDRPAAGAGILQGSTSGAVPARHRQHAELGDGKTQDGRAQPDRQRRQVAGTTKISGRAFAGPHGLQRRAGVHRKGKPPPQFFVQVVAIMDAVDLGHFDFGHDPLHFVRPGEGVAGSRRWECLGELLERVKRAAVAVDGRRLPGAAFLPLLFIGQVFGAGQAHDAGDVLDVIAAMHLGNRQANALDCRPVFRRAGDFVDQLPKALDAAAAIDGEGWRHRPVEEFVDQRADPHLFGRQLGGAALRVEVELGCAQIGDVLVREFVVRRTRIGLVDRIVEVHPAVASVGPFVDGKEMAGRKCLALQPLLAVRSDGHEIVDALRIEFVQEIACGVHQSSIHRLIGTGPESVALEKRRSISTYRIAGPGNTPP